MRNKTGIIILTVIVSLLCIYYLSFTFVSRGIKKDATEYATSADGKVDFRKRQAYLDSLWKKPVYDLGFTSYTYKEVTDKELNLGLDLQGGMHVTLEVSPVEICVLCQATARTLNSWKLSKERMSCRKTARRNILTYFTAPTGK
jgi:SecD/SecF fusion protein